MKRLDRVRHIRDQILSVPQAQWTWEQLSDLRYLALHTPYWSASLFTPFGGQINTLPAATNFQQAQILQTAKLPLPNVMDVRLRSGGKVLSMEWDDNEIRLISMRRGEWESELFGLPDYREKAPRGRGMT